MNDPLQTLLRLTANANIFPVTSRYYNSETSLHTFPDGRVVRYIRRRFIPSPGRFALLGEHVVTEGERLDNVTAQHLGDPEQFWRICDANVAMIPDELMEEPGRRLRITLPEGIPGI